MSGREGDRERDGGSIRIHCMLCVRRIANNVVVTAAATAISNQFKIHLKWYIETGSKRNDKMAITKEKKMCIENLWNL